MRRMQELLGYRHQLLAVPHFHIRQLCLAAASLQEARSRFTQFQRPRHTFHALTMNDDKSAMRKRALSHP